MRMLHDSGVERCNGRRRLNGWLQACFIVLAGVKERLFIKALMLQTHR
jgi:hypothetical protein